MEDEGGGLADGEEDGLFDGEQDDRTFGFLFMWRIGREGRLTSI